MNSLVIGLQWGDEGKGKVIDYLAGDFQVVIRYQGGHNAGHTVYHQGRKFVLHLLPSGIFYPATLSVIAHGVVVNPVHLVNEIRQAQEEGITLGRLVLSEAAPLILPFHQRLDVIFEQSRYQRIGTTQRGIGPAYEDLTGRRAIFIRDLIDPGRFRRKLEPLSDYYNVLIRAFGGEPVAIESYLNEYLAAGKQLQPLVADTVTLLNQLLAQERSMLFEGAQGTLLDISLGTYPYVTSSHPTPGGLFCGTGLPPKALQRVIGIFKAYTTRVGEGPFPTELNDATGERLRQSGGEFGATTGRPRRVGWLDLVALRHAVMVNGVDELFITKIDVLDDLDEIQVAVAYDINGQLSDSFSPDPEFLDKVRPVYQRLPGWNCKIDAIKKQKDLPAKTREYLRFIEKFVGVPIGHVSLGTRRDQTVRLIKK